jgi:hypothetical protein
MLFGGTEWSITFGLPYCDQCRPTAERIPPSFGKKFWVWLLWLWIIFLGATIGFIATDTATPENGWAFFAGCAVLSAAGVFSWYSRRRPVGDQTSFYQPVRVLKLKQKFSGETVGIVLGFTNPRFAEDFLKLNPEAKRA